jgi:hypothetical protein
LNKPNVAKTDHEPEDPMKDLASKYGMYALVTGASSGIGAQFATQLAAAGLQLVLVARRKDRLEALASELRARHGTAVEIIELDLARNGAVAELARRTEHLDVGFLVAAAGVITSGPFVRGPLDAETGLLTVNLVVPMQLAHTFGARFAERGRGGMVLISSTVGNQAAPYLANYAAAKAYIASLGQALNYELKRDGVDVLVLEPGPTRTEGVETAEGIDFSKLPLPMMAPHRVVRKALRSIGRRQLVIPGRLNRFTDVMGKYLTPRRVQTAMYGLLLSRALVEPTPTRDQA